MTLYNRAPEFWGPEIPIESVEELNCKWNVNGELVGYTMQQGNIRDKPSYNTDKYDRLMEILEIYQASEMIGLRME